MRPIPKKLLIHTVMLIHLARKDRWGKEVSGGDTVVHRVRIEPSSNIVKDKDNNEIQLAATLFYDCKNSLPTDAVFALEDIVEFNDQKHQVKLVEPLYDGQRLHHYEIGLVRHA